MSVEPLRETLRTTRFQRPARPVTYGPRWAVAAWLFAGLVAILPAALLLRRGYDPQLRGTVVCFTAVVLPCALAFVVIGSSLWRGRWRLDPTGFRGEGAAFAWDDVEQVRAHVTLPESTQALDHWLEVTVELRDGSRCTLEPDGFDRLRAMMACVPRDRRDVA